MISPLNARPAGNPVALQLVTGRFVLSVSENVLLKAVPTTPDAVCPAVMSGTPSEMVKETATGTLGDPLYEEPVTLKIY
jgi:hypothetical protein